MTEMMVSVVLLGMLAVIYGSYFGSARAFLGNVGFFNTACETLDATLERLSGAAYDNTQQESSLSETYSAPAPLSIPENGAEPTLHLAADPVIFEYQGAPALKTPVAVQGALAWWVRESRASVHNSPAPYTARFKEITMAISWRHKLFSGLDPIEEILPLSFHKFRDFIDPSLESATMALWHMDYTRDDNTVVGNARDASANAMHLIVPQPNLWTAGFDKRAVAIAQSPLYVDGVFFPSKTESWTFETWIGPLRESATYTLFSYNNTALTITRKSPGYNTLFSSISLTIKGLNGAGQEVTETVTSPFSIQSLTPSENQYDPGPYWAMLANNCFSTECTSNLCDPISCNENTCPLAHCDPDRCDPFLCEDCARYYELDCMHCTTPACLNASPTTFCATAVCAQTPACFPNGVTNPPCDPKQCDARCGGHSDMVDDCANCDRLHPCSDSMTCAETAYTPHFLDAFDPDTGTESWNHVALAMRPGEYIKIYIHDRNGALRFYSYMNISLTPRAGNFRFSLGSSGLVMDDVRVTARELTPSEFLCGDVVCAGN